MASNITQTTCKDTNYMRMLDFLQFMETSEAENPYRVKFSFDKYISAMSAQYDANCKFSADIVPFLSDVEKKMEHEKEAVCENLKKEATRMLMPSLFVQSEMSFISKPFSKNFTQASKSLMDFFHSDEWEIRVDEEKIARKNKTIAIGSYILKQCYGVEAFDYYTDTIEFKNSKNGHTKHLEIGIKFDFVDVIPTQPLKPLSEQEIATLLNSQFDPEPWLELLPPDRFLIKGFTLCTFHDITKIQIHSKMRENIAEIAENTDAEARLQNINMLFKSYLRDDSIEIGLANLLFIDLVDKDVNSMSLTNELDIRKIISPEMMDGRCGYSDAVYRNKIVVLDDLRKLTKPSLAEKRLLKNGIESVILIPVESNVDKKLIAILEIGSHKPMGLNNVTLMKLKEMIQLMKMMINTFSKEMDKRVDLIIRDHFTSIHPSVEWKFKEVATQHQINVLNQTGDTSLAPITFEHVYPLYGQADIVGSSKLRNEALREDLLFNLNSLNKLMDIWLSKRHFFLLKSYQVKIATIISQLENGFESSDESVIIELLHNEIHPLLEQLKGRHDDLPESPYAEYISLLDSDLGIIYNKRKLYEESVMILNSEISEYFSQEDLKMQKTLPHYFEKYKTDGVEYNIYLGQSILENGSFSENDIREFRIWQIQKMIEVTKKVAEISPTLPVPITTAQLIFVYNNELKIRFRMEEKKFDVDGAYNVRYEILKKRIDKATIKGTNERLTVSGKVAIVYLQEKEKREYLQYIEFLQSSGQLEDHIEELELNPLPGAEGLKALRLTVKTQFTLPPESLMNLFSLKYDSLICGFFCQDLEQPLM